MCLIWFSLVVLLGFFHPKVFHMWMSLKYIISMQVKEGCLVTGRPAAAGEALVALGAAACSLPAFLRLHCCSSSPPWS
jgi:hypothetical protein